MVPISCASLISCDDFADAPFCNGVVELDEQYTVCPCTPEAETVGCYCATIQIKCTHKIIGKIYATDEKTMQALIERSRK